jgi:hypothetical protein
MTVICMKSPHVFSAREQGSELGVFSSRGGSTGNELTVAGRSSK